MNDERRKLLSKIAEQLSAIQGALQSIHDDEEEAFNNMPESLQQGDKGQESEQYVSDLDEMIEQVAEAQTKAEEIAAS